MRSNYQLARLSASRLETVIPSPTKYKPSLVRIDARNFVLTDPQTHKQTHKPGHRQDRLQCTARQCKYMFGLLRVI